MKIKNILGLMAAALFMLMGVNTAMSQSAVHPKEYYDAISYQWTDANGVSHTNALTDEATDPYQIVALLKKVYCDPNIPGPRYTAFDQNGNREREVYYGAVDGGWNISASDVTPPYEEGYTILMVALNNNITRIGTETEQMTENSWFWGPSYGTFKSNFFTTTNELIDYIRNNVTSVLLLTDGLRVGSGTMSGTTFNISGEFNRFFVLGKGQSRQKDSWVLQQENSYDYPIIAGEYVPFKSMFEQFSPTDGTEGSQITDFYAQMVNGKLYPVVHDCASVIESEHEFSMSGQNGTEYKSLTGMNIFIPDYRLMYWVDDQFYIHYTNGNTEGPYSVDGRTMNPYKRINGSNFRDPGYLASNYAKYNLEYSPKMGIYTINLEAEAQPTSEEHVYDVNLEWESSLDELSNEAVPQTYILYLVLTDEEGNEVHQEVIVTNDNSYTYQVPQNEHSYTLTYIVYAKPADGEHDVFVAWSNQASVVIPGWYDFLNLALNHYESDYVPSEELNYYRNFLNVQNEDAVNALTPERVAAGENAFTLYRFVSDNPDVMTPVAQLTMTAGANGVTYAIAYENQEPLAGYNVPMTNNGTLAVNNNGALILDNILFVDQFTAITAENSHPNRYGYMLALNDDSKTTNTVEVPVLKTSSTINGFYTIDEVTNDVDAQLTAGVKNAEVEMTLANNPAIYYYTMERGDNAAPNDAISKLQRRTDGTFMEMNNHLGMAGNIYEAGLYDLYDNDMLTGSMGDFVSYVPVIWTFGDNRVKQDGENSYGSPILKTGVANVTPAVDGVCTEGETGEWKDENGKTCRIYYPTITAVGELPEEASVTYEPYMFRVWRLCDGVRGYQFNGNKPVNDPNADRSPVKLIIEEQTDDNMIEIGGEYQTNPLGFGALKDANIQFKVRFYYKKADLPLRGGDNGPMYYVVEKTIEWNEIPTGIYEVRAANEVSKTYINAQGIESSTPFDGVNIVITRYSDGSTSTAKVIK